MKILKHVMARVLDFVQQHARMVAEMVVRGVRTVVKMVVQPHAEVAVVKDVKALVINYVSQTA
jgi:hypothetical protein